MFDLLFFQASINLQKNFGVPMQLITMNYLTSFPESLQMYKWYVVFIIILIQYSIRFLTFMLSKEETGKVNKACGRLCHSGTQSTWGANLEELTEKNGE